MSDPTILAFDTSAAHCAAALLWRDAICGERLEHLQRGQAERLMPMLEAVLSERGLAWRDLDAIGVGIGPGNFTGIRISVSAARGLALALGIPAVGVSMFEAMRDRWGQAAHPAELVSLEGPKGSAYVQLFRYGKPRGAPRQIDPAAPPDDLRVINLEVRGYRAEDIARRFDAPWTEAALTDIAARIAWRAEWRLCFDRETPTRPAPIYIRPADAAPPREAPPVILP